MSVLRSLAILYGLVVIGPASARPLAILDARVYPGAASPPLARASVLIDNGKIIAVGERVRIPPDAEVIRCNGCVLMAGFWNSHVHFTEAKWEDAARQPSSKLAAQLQSMLTGSGFTTVVDTASDLANTLALRRRIDSGEIPGPRIYTAGVPVFPPDGVPYYVKENIPPATLKQLVPPRNSKEAVEAVALNIQGGADIVKVFTGSWIERGKVLPMPEPIATAVVKVAHEHHRLVFTHPSNLAGIQVAITSGVDVLAHAPEEIRGVDDTILRKAIANHMAMIPTLKLFSGDNDIADIRGVVRRFHDLGGELIFGTDTGYLTDYDVSEEFRQLGKTGLGTSEILAMLTENPARRFGVDKDRGRIAPGMAADITILESDPAADISAFARIRCTIRNGRVIYSRPSAR